MNDYERYHFARRSERRVRVIDRVGQTAAAVASLACLSAIGEGAAFELFQLPESTGFNESILGSGLVVLLASKVAAVALQCRDQIVRRSIDKTGFDPGYAIPVLDIFMEPK